MTGSRLLLALGTLAASAAAAHASAATTPDVFELTVSATSTASWDHTGAPEPSGDCTTSLRAQGARTARLRSTRATIVRFAGGRIKTVAVGSLAGTVTFTGTNTTTQTCGPDTNVDETTCTKARRRFSNARTTISSARPGVIAIGPPRVALRRSACPSEPDEAAATPLGPAPKSLRVASRTLANDVVMRITLRSSVTRSKRYAAPETGTLRQHASWKVTLTRVRP